MGFRTQLHILPYVNFDFYKMKTKNFKFLYWWKVFLFTDRLMKELVFQAFFTCEGMSFNVFNTALMERIQNFLFYSSRLLLTILSGFLPDQINFALFV